MSFLNGSPLPGSEPPSHKPDFAVNLDMKREYKRCRIACSMPPMYKSTGIASEASVLSNGLQLDFEARGDTVLCSSDLCSVESTKKNQQRYPSYLSPFAPVRHN